MSTLLEVKDITKIYPNQPKPGLDHVSFEVEKGEFLGIMGASGSGKTTLLNVLSTIDIPTSGHIIMGKTHIEKLGQGQAADFRKNNLGFIFQEYFLWAAFCQDKKSRCSCKFKSFQLSLLFG